MISIILATKFKGSTKQFGKALVISLFLDALTLVSCFNFLIP